MFETIPHGFYPFDESPWVKHFHDTNDINQRRQIHAANFADQHGHDELARHILAAGPGENPMATYKGPFDEGEKGLNVSQALPPEEMTRYFGDYTPMGGTPGQGPFADPRKFVQPGARWPGVETGPAWALHNRLMGGQGP